MDKRTIEIKKLAMQLQAVVELDNSLGVEYCSLPGGLKALKLNPDRGRDLAMTSERDQAVAERTESDAAAIPARKTPVSRPNIRVDTAPAAAVIPLGGTEEKVRKINELNMQVASCRECVLAQERNYAVGGEGLVDAGVAFVASAPGREEDRTGCNFQGAAGQLVFDIIEKGMKISREEVYFTSIVKCRPPGNRELLLVEIDACNRYFAAEMRIVAPRVIIAVGAAAANILTGQQSPIEQLRGIWYDYCGIPVMPIYHPSFLLRQRRRLGHNNEYVRQTWQDIKQVLNRLAEPSR